MCRTTTRPAETPNLQEPQTLLSELAQEREEKNVEEVALSASSQHIIASSDRDTVERIAQLEEALEQSLVSLDELGLKLKDQHILETQLAATEEIANLQQQAITELQRQLVQQQQSLNAQATATQTQEQVFQNLLMGIETIAQTQQSEIGRLKTQLTHNRTAFRAYQQQMEQQLAVRQTALENQQERVMELESQNLTSRTLAVSLEIQLSEAVRQVETLRQQACERISVLTQRSAELEQEQFLVDEQSSAIAALQQELVVAQAKIEALETQIAGQHTAQARLQHAYQELETERDALLTRLTQLEQQTVVLQEQLLQQAQQAGEYEAAVQFWKERYHARQDQALQLKEALERLVPDHATEILDLLRAIQPPAVTEGTDSVDPKFSLHNQPLQVDLPAFLTRRRRPKS